MTDLERLEARTAAERKTPQAFMRAYDPDPGHALQVRRVSLALFDALAGLHGLGSDARTVLDAAALVHDTGYALGRGKHHKRARDLVLREGLAGFSERGTLMAACVARYHRKAVPALGHKGYRDLGPEDQSTVRKLSALLRLADGLDRCHASSVRAVQVHVGPETVIIRVEQDHPSLTDIAGAMRKRGLFETEFGRHVAVVPMPEDAD